MSEILFKSQCFTMFAIGAATLLAPLPGAESEAAAMTLDWATVGDAGNAPDSTGYGSVSYEYRISKHEVTNAQYVEFLNAVAASDPNNLYSTGMTSNASFGGIARSGQSGSYTYAVKVNMADKPVIFVSWYDAARFTNWLHNGQGNANTETGAYTLTGPTSVAGGRASNAQVFLPSEDEWYKAAYYQPAAEGGDNDGYWLYATASNTAPTVAADNAAGDISNPGTNVANYNKGADRNGEINGNITTVGSAGINSESYYGTSDQAGNVWEMFETAGVIRGGVYASPDFRLESDYRLSVSATTETVGIGFRVASLVPEPGSLVLLGLGAVLLPCRRRSRFDRIRW